MNYLTEDLVWSVEENFDLFFVCQYFLSHYCGLIFKVAFFFKNTVIPIVPARKAEKIVSSTARIGSSSKMHLNMSEMYIERIASTVAIARILSIVLLPIILVPLD
jgi:hypothetical protein